MSELRESSRVMSQIFQKHLSIFLREKHLPIVTRVIFWIIVESNTRF